MPAPPDWLVSGTNRAIVVLLFASLLLISHPAAWPVLAFQTAVFALLAMWLAIYVRRPFQQRGNLVLAALALTTLWGAVQLAAGWTGNRDATARAALGWGSNLALYWISLQVFSVRRLRFGAERALLIFGFLLSVVASLQIFSSGRIFWVFDTPYEDTVLGPFVNRDHYAAFIELVLPFALWQAVTKAKNSTGYALMAAAMFASVVAGASRAGFGILVAEVAYVLLAGHFRQRSSRAVSIWRVAVAMLAAGAVFVGVVGWEALWRRFQDPDPYRGRREMLASGIAMIKDRPATGFGLGTLESVYPAYARFDSGHTVAHLHNDWVEWAAEGGVVFLTPLLAIFGIAIRAGWTAPWSIGVTAVFLHALVDFPLQKPPLMAWLIVVLAMSVGRDESVRTRSS
jgi:O-antigen ligase